MGPIAQATLARTTIAHAVLALPGHPQPSHEPPQRLLGSPLLRPTRPSPEGETASRQAFAAQELIELVVPCSREENSNGAASARQRLRVGIVRFW
jgi:hypothetical protein